MIGLSRLFGALFENRTPRQTIAKNTFWLFAGQLISRLFRAGIVIYAARILGVESWGAFSYALGIITFLTTFSDMGVNALITKEGARHPELKHAYLATAFVTKLAIIVLLGSATLLFLPLLATIEEAQGVLPILLLVFVFDTLRDVASSFSRALERMQVEAGAQIFTNVLIALLGFLFLAASPTSSALAFAYAFGSAIGFTSILIPLRTYFKNIAAHFRASLIKPLLLSAWPFGLMMLMGTIMLNTDIVMLGWLRSAREVGYYAVAQKLMQLLYVLPALLAASMFPLTARLTKSNPERTRTLLERSVAAMLLLGTLGALIGIPLARPIVILLFGAAYAPAIPTFQLLLTTLLIVYPSLFLGNALFAYDEQKRFLFFVLLAAGGNILLNFLFIPSMGIEGAALSTILTQLITNFFIWKRMRALSRFRISDGFAYLSRFGRPD